MFAKVLIANRGAIACRIIRTLRKMGVSSVAVFSDADAGSLHVAEADEAVRIGPAPAVESYLDVDAILDAAKATGAEAIHPGYGFLSENAEFAEKCAAAGIAFVGPTPDNMRVFGLKHTARALAAAHGVPLAPGTDLLADEQEALRQAESIGYPVILKATAGGGGIGMKICHGPDDVRADFAVVARLGSGNFGDGGVFLERYVARARHIEVQVFGDGQGRVVALGERDCSLQRRNQKVLEETPAPLLPAATRAALMDCAVRLTTGAKYRSAGTVEFLYDSERDDFFFLEVNTRLQVEHGVTEQVTGVDLVEWMIRGAAGDFGFLDGFVSQPKGAAIQARLYAEDPALDYRPSSGRLIHVDFPSGPRVDGWVESGTDVSAWYDPLLAKLIVTAPTREAAVTAMQEALDGTRLAGIETNVDWLRTVVRSEPFVTGNVSTRALAEIGYTPRTIRVLSAGASTTVQDYPGRVGLWNVGVPPSGPMDALAFRLGNRLLGNAEGAAGLEMTAAGPTLEFNTAARLCLTGADFGASLDGRPLACYTPFDAKPGQVLKVGRVSGDGMRGYILVEGGIEAPDYLGSRSTFTLGEFGGHAGRAVMTGDTLHINRAEACTGKKVEALSPSDRPEIASEWTLRVLYGPHGAPDFFTTADIAMLRSAQWKVHYNSNRTGVRLVGPKPEWARRDGGEAGLHPSNIHDNAYAVGAIDFTGDMPIILGPDGPSLGGFVCPFVVAQADLWKVGQLAPGDSVRFLPVDNDMAVAAEQAQDSFIAKLSSPPPEAKLGEDEDLGSPILRAIPSQGVRPAVTYRQQGDRNLLVEYGPIVLDLELRLRVHALMLEIDKLALPGVIEVTPGIRSLQVHYDSRLLPQSALIEALSEAEERLGGLDDFEIPSRVVHLPLSWKDPAIYETINKYMASVRDDAPWCPDNIEFIRRVNGLESIEDVKRIVFDAEYLVMGLGDVYLGAPVATPVDPRHRLVTTKYNPARTWTPPNVVGIGGAYMCIYGMEGPGGYQLFGRTIQVWNSWRQTEMFREGKPWLLRFFDRIRFFPVSHSELTEWRREFPLGRRSIRIDEEVFRLSEYRAFMAENADSIAAFESRRQAAFGEERAQWERDGEFNRVAALAEESGSDEDTVTIELPAGCELVEAPFGGSLWKLLADEGSHVEAGDSIAIIEAMKMESHITTPISGIVRRIYVEERQSISPGGAILAVEVP
ncbi:urea carboxylase [Novosphingobium pentaromativorans]|uniref:Urea carboxylase n=1 Tax=Novosphingobium pentaromativorans US6-1 TaxID=1088721 RepID=G6EG42_9SPHN|nr:urea carboxylase [Novosphingobium pentaromativorans]AIT82265.1 urea carboxylase [Novosphingobium pentaromativorans US6-1]EHJ59731.1 urea carboxylase [Novosphingobium pentaromativorans US6-1]